MDHTSSTGDIDLGHPVDVRGYLAVFGALLVLTLATVGVSYVELPTGPSVLVALAIAGSKASLVAMFFMHLKGERPMIYWSLGLTAVLFAALFAFLLWSEGDHLFGTRFEDAFGRPAAAHGAGGSHEAPNSQGGGH
jgi:cytochrome c oxidase subunit 4